MNTISAIVLTSLAITSRRTATSAAKHAVDNRHAGRDERATLCEVLCVMSWCLFVVLLALVVVHYVLPLAIR